MPSPHYAFKEKSKIGARGLLRSKAHVMRAVILRDVRTRFFNHGMGFVLVPLWPLGHLVILLIVYRFVGHTAPYGSSLNIFFATGLIPTLTFMYVSRFMGLSVLMNRPMLAFPSVKITDILAARAVLETLAACMMAFLAFALLLAVGDNPFPYDPLQAAAAFASTILLSIGVGTIVSLMFLINKIFVTLYFLSMIVVYLTSGILFVPSSLPNEIITFMQWDPILQGVVWMRNSYIYGYPDQILHRWYMVIFSGCTLVIGLILERLLRPKLLHK